MEFAGDFFKAGLIKGKKILTMKNKTIFFIIYFLILFFIKANAIESTLKYIIIFIGDGMHKEHQTAASRFFTGEDEKLIWHSFPYKGYVSTWDINTYNRYAYINGKQLYSKDNTDYSLGYSPLLGGKTSNSSNSLKRRNYFLNKLPLVYKEGFYKIPATDSAASATAMFTGQKVETKAVSFRAYNDENKPLTTIAEIFRDKNKGSIGIITTVPFNHATPAALITHSATRNNYFTPVNTKEGIANQMIGFTPQVLIGGGHPAYNKGWGLKKYLSDELYNSIKKNKEYIFIERKKNINASESIKKAANQAIVNNKKLFALFGTKKGHFNSFKPLYKDGTPIIKRNTKENPYLKDCVLAALNVLSQNNNGFFLLAEQGDIDWANHENNYKHMIGAMWDLDKAVDAAVKFINKPDDNIDWSNTILIVTSDHANSYMRIKNKEKFIKGFLPAQIKLFNYHYPLREVKYYTHDHTNELVDIYIKGKGIDSFKKNEGKYYPNTRILDNTQIFDSLLEELRKTYLYK